MRKLWIIAICVVVAAALGYFLIHGSGSKNDNRAHHGQAAESGARDLSFAETGEDAPMGLAMLCASSQGLTYDMSKTFIDALHSMGYDTSIVVTGSTVNSVTALLKNEGQLMQASSDRAALAYNNMAHDPGRELLRDLRVLMTLNLNYVQIITLANSGLDSIHDLEGKKLVIDDVNSDSDVAMHKLFESCDVHHDSADIEYAPLYESLDGLRDGKYDAMVIIGLLGGDRIETVKKRGFDIRLIPVDDEDYERLKALNPYFLRAFFPADVYGLPEDVATIATANIMLVSNDVPDEEIFGLLDNYFEQQKDLEQKFTLMRQISFFYENPALDVGVPLHEGAVQYYTAHGF